MVHIFNTHLHAILDQDIRGGPLTFYTKVNIATLIRDDGTAAVLIASFITRSLMTLTPTLIVILNTSIKATLVTHVLAFSLS